MRQSARHGASGFFVGLLSFEPDLHAGANALADLHGGEVEPIKALKHGGIGPGGKSVEKVKSPLRAGQHGLALGQPSLGHSRPKGRVGPALAGGVARENLQNPGAEAV